MVYTGDLGREELEVFDTNYWQLLQKEVVTVGVKPTEIRHLIGRLGEFRAALDLGGTLARRVNQHGFDVRPQGRTVSVKTTAQRSGFVPVNLKTVGLCDDLCVYQYVDGSLEQVYWGPIGPAVEVGRIYGQNSEIQIARLREPAAAHRGE